MPKLLSKGQFLEGPGRCLLDMVQMAACARALASSYRWPLSLLLCLCGTYLLVSLITRHGRWSRLEFSLARTPWMYTLTTTVAIYLLGELLTY